MPLYNMSTSDHIKALLQRYQQGLCTPEEVAQLEIWFDQVQQDNDRSLLLGQADEDRLVRRLQADPRFALPGRPKKVYGLFRRLPRLAAAVWIGLLLAAGVVVWLAIQQRTAAPAVQELAFVEVNAGPGKRVKLVLPDSSVVWLNSGSHLAYHPLFAENRQVRLRGEAFFEVTPDQAHPFTVKAGNVNTRVYGTAFNIAAWANTNELKVALQHGRIGVTTDTASISQEQILLPGQLLVYNKQMRTVQVAKEDTADMGAWVSGTLIFNKAPIKEVMAQLESMYAIHCLYPEGVPNQVITARFDHVTLEKIVEHISFGWNIQFHRRGDTLFVQ